jgi:choice-of-anchor C domain-containing protein
VDTKRLLPGAVGVLVALLHCGAACAQPPDGTVPLLLYWHGDRQDNLTLSTKATQKAAEAAGYGYSRIEGYVFQKPRDGTVPLLLYVRPDQKEYCTLGTEVGARAAEAAGYKFAGVEGYVFREPREGTVPLLLYFSAARKDHFTTSTKVGKKSAEDAGYVLAGVQGFVYPANFHGVAWIRQGGSQTCWILSAMEALKVSGVDLQKQVQPIGANRYRISLYNFVDAAKPDADIRAERYVVAFDGKTIDQDPVIAPGDTKRYWVVALHRGVITAVHQWDPSQTIEKTHGGGATHSFGILTGRSAVPIGVTDPNIRTTITQALKRRAAIVLGTKGDAKSLVAGHYYAVMAATANEIILHNPWGDTKPYPWELVVKEGTSFEMVETKVNRPDNLLVNGSFEEGPAVDDTKPITPGSGLIQGWTVTRGQIVYVGDRWASADGYRSVELHGSPGFGGIQQTFETTKGQRYRVTFTVAGAPEGEVRNRRIGVSAAGKKAEFSFDATGKSLKNMGWVLKEWEFDATDSQTTLEFYTLETRDGAHGPALDDVRVVPVAAANLIVNGSFEEGPDVNGITALDAGSTAIKGWKVTHNLFVIGSGFAAADGKRSVFFPGAPVNGGIAQTFKTTKGQRYRVTFALGANPNGGRWAKEFFTTRLAVSAADRTQDFTFDSTDKTGCDVGWVTKTWDFDAVADQTTLEFRMVETTPNFWNGPAIDSVRVWAIPRP